MSDHSRLETLPTDVLGFITNVHKTEVNANERLIENMYYIFHLSVDPGILSYSVNYNENIHEGGCDYHEFVDVCTETDLQQCSPYFSHEMERYAEPISFTSEFISEDIRFYEASYQYTRPYFMLIKKKNYNMETLNCLSINCAILIYLLYYRETAKFDWMSDYNKETFAVANLEYVGKVITDNFECFTDYYETIAEFHKMAKEKGFLQGSEWKP